MKPAYDWLICRLLRDLKNRNVWISSSCRFILHLNEPISLTELNFNRQDRSSVWHCQVRDLTVTTGIRILLSYLGCFRSHFPRFDFAVLLLNNPNVTQTLGTSVTSPRFNRSPYRSIYYFSELSSVISPVVKPSRETYNQTVSFHKYAAKFCTYRTTRPRIFLPRAPRLWISLAPCVWFPLSSMIWKDDPWKSSL